MDALRGFQMRCITTGLHFSGGDGTDGMTEGHMMMKNSTHDPETQGDDHAPAVVLHLES